MEMEDGSIFTGSNGKDQRTDRTDRRDASEADKKKSRICIRLLLGKLYGDGSVRI